MIADPSQALQGIMRMGGYTRLRVIIAQPLHYPSDGGGEALDALRLCLVYVSRAAREHGVGNQRPDHRSHVTCQPGRARLPSNRFDDVVVVGRPRAYWAR